MKQLVFLVAHAAALLALPCTVPRCIGGVGEAAFGAAEAYIDEGNYGPAIREYHKIVYQAQDLGVRDRARYGIARSYYLAYDFDKAQASLRELAERGTAEWAAAARLLLAEIHIGRARFASAVSELKSLIADHPQSAEANQAHYLVGKRLFDLGRFEAAAQRLEMVGTAFRAAAAGQLTLEPGEPLYIQLVDADLYIGPDHPGVELEITTERGEAERTRLRPLPGSPDVLMASLPTALGDPVPGSGALEVCGSDEVMVRYLDAVAEGGHRNVARKSSIRVAANALLQLLSGDRAQNIDFLLLDGASIVRVRDADRDVSTERDAVHVQVLVPRGQPRELRLLESERHSGVFEGPLVPVNTDRAVQGAVRAQAGDRLQILYEDSRRSSLSEPTKEVSVYVDVVKSTAGTIRSLGALMREDELEKMTAMERGKSYMIIGKAHDHIGLRADAEMQYRKALGEFRYVLEHAPEGSAGAADALRMCWKVYLEQGNYDAAFGTCVRLIKSYSGSELAVDALFSLATELEHKNPRQATHYYRKLVEEFPRHEVAGRAQYRIAADCKRQAFRDPRMGETCVREFLRLIELFPDSEHVPEALSFITGFHQRAGNYDRALDFARRLASSYAAASYVEEGVIAEGRALLELGRHREALTVFRKIAFDNPNAKSEVEPLIHECERAVADAAQPNAGTVKSSMKDMKRLPN